MAKNDKGVEGYPVGKRSGRYMGQPGVPAPGNPKGEYPYKGKGGKGSGRHDQSKGGKKK